jgi:hypothetical protein
MRPVVAVAFLLVAFAADAALQVRHIQVSVPPYYVSAPSKSDRPRVGISNKYNALLASGRREDVAAVRDAIRAEPLSAMPPVLMVLAVRLYDAGLRDDAVFWFNAAKGRHATIDAVLDMNESGFGDADRGTREFVRIVGPVINAYAYCDVPRQAALRRDAIDWVEKNPYQGLFLEKLTARPGDRRANLERSIAVMRSDLREDMSSLEVPANAERVAAARRETEADEKYCWK